MISSARNPQRHGKTRMVRRPQAGRRLVARLVADKTDVGHGRNPAQQHEIDPLVWICHASLQPCVGKACIDRRFVGRKVSGPFAAAAAIFVQDPVTVPVLPGVALAKIYGLTPAEVRVLLAMSPGFGIKEAADILGIGETTAKTHLQRIFSKTGTSKQTELMILLRNSVPPVSAA
jgi:DNA-binding CsgD family transcriptional regulator